jgi:TonB family protein
MRSLAAPGRLLLLLLLLLPSGVAAQARISYEIPPDRSHCTKVQDYVPPPSLAELADSAALDADFRRLLERVPAEDRVVTALVHFRPNGEVERVEIPRGVDGRIRKEVEAVVRSRVRPQPPRSRPFEWPLQVEADQPPAFEIRVLPFLVCDPELANGRILQFLMREDAARFAAEHRLGGPGGRTVVVRARITATGLMKDFRVARSSGDPAIDEAALRMMRLAEFRPGLVYAGSPRLQGVPMLIQMPVTFAPPGARGP